MLEFVEVNDRLPNFYIPKARVEEEPELEEEYWLGRWCRSQGKQVALRLTPVQVKLLKVIPAWPLSLELTPINTSVFQDRCKQLQEFVARDGRLPKAYALDAAESKLGVWVREMRKRRHVWGDLTEGQQRALEALKGWTWKMGPDYNPKGPAKGFPPGSEPWLREVDRVWGEVDKASISARWRDRFWQVVGWAEQHGHLPMELSHRYKKKVQEQDTPESQQRLQESSLARWCRAQRHENLPRMSPAQVQLLEVLTGSKIITPITADTADDTL